MKSDIMMQQLIDWVTRTTPPGHDLLIPVSGGSDSALCFWFCNQALPGRVKGVFSGHNLREKAWFEAQGEMMYLDALTDSTNPEVERWSQFQALNLQEQRILVGTRNRTEDCLGTYSLASRIATYLPLVGVWKSDVMALCESIGMPESITASSQKADPDCGRPEELAALPFTFVDTFLQVKLGERPSSDVEQLTVDQREYLEELYQRNAFKRELPARGPLVGVS
jgi:NH3-dependent NAD+ synthetase